MSLYIEYIKKMFQLKLTYRFSFIISILTEILWVFIQINVWQALFRNRVTINNIDLNDMISYVILTLFISALTDTWVGGELADSINSGEIGSVLIKPINIKYYLIAEDLGRKLANILFSIIPTCIIASLYWGFILPDINLSFLLFILSLINGMVIMYLINYILGLLAFWLHTSWYISWYLRAFFILFSGSMVPLWFYPDILYNMSRYLPFRLISFDPINIYLDKLSIQDSIFVIISQLFWILILFVLEKLIWYRAEKKIVIYGG